MVHTFGVDISIGRVLQLVVDMQQQGVQPETFTHTQCSPLWNEHVFRQGFAVLYWHAAAGVQPNTLTYTAVSSASGMVTWLIRESSLMHFYIQRSNQRIWNGHVFSQGVAVR